MLGNVNPTASRFGWQKKPARKLFPLGK